MLRILLVVLILLAAAQFAEVVKAGNVYDCEERPAGKLSVSPGGRLWVVFSSNSEWPIRGLEIDRDANVRDWLYKSEQPFYIDAVSAEDDGQVFLLGSVDRSWAVAGYDRRGTASWIDVPIKDFHDNKITYYTGGGEIESLTKLVVGSQYLFSTVMSYSGNPDDSADSEFPDVYWLSYNRNGSPIEYEKLTPIEDILTIELISDGSGGAIRVLEFISDDRDYDGQIIERFGETGELIYRKDCRKDHPAFWGYILSITSTNDGGALLAIYNAEAEISMIYSISNNGDLDVWSEELFAYIESIKSDGKGGVYVLMSNALLTHLDQNGNKDWEITLSSNIRRLSAFDVEIDGEGDYYIYYNLHDDTTATTESNLAAIDFNGDMKWNQGGNSGLNVKYIKYVEDAGLFLVGVFCSNINGNISSCNMAINLLDAEDGGFQWSYVRDDAESCGLEPKDEDDDDSGCGCGC